MFGICSTLPRVHPPRDAACASEAERERRPRGPLLGLDLLPEQENLTATSDLDNNGCASCTSEASGIHDEWPTMSATVIYLESNIRHSCNGKLVPYIS